MRRVFIDCIGEFARQLVREHGIEPHVTVFDKAARKDGTFSREDFTYDHERDVYFCPGGKTLTTTGTRVNDGATSCSQTRPCGMRPEVPVLPKYPDPEGAAVHP